VAAVLGRKVGELEIESDVEDGPPILATPRLIPVVGRVQAGVDGLLNIYDYPPESPDGHMLWYTSCVEAYVLRVRGESMSPRYLPGEFVGVDPCAEVLPSDEVIVLMKDGQRMIKRLLWVRDEQACLESVNKDHPNIVIDCEDVDAMHLVLGHIPKSAFRSNV
jgi:phage repressor protein C with HTH and peptisase S24 domain